MYEKTGPAGARSLFSAIFIVFRELPGTPVYQLATDRRPPAFSRLFKPASHKGGP